MDVSGSKVYPPPPAVGMVCSSLPVQRATINGLKGAPICLTGKQSTLPPMNDCLFLLDYRRTNAGRRCHCDLVPTMLFTERSETSKERVNLNVSDNSKGRDRISSAWLVDTSNAQRAFFSIFMLHKYCIRWIETVSFVPDLIL